MEKATPFFSILIPLYNTEEYLYEALTSLIDQDFQEAEFIIINDGSTDGSREIAKSFLQKDNRFTLLEQENRGYGAAMNRGLEAAQGLYIGILEPDDRYISELLHEAYKTLQKHKNLDILKGDFTLFSSNKDHYKEEPGKLKSKLFDEKCNLQNNPLLLVNNPSIWSAFYRREFLEQSKIRFIETAGASFQDLPFFFDTLNQAKSIIVTREIFYYYRQNNSQSSINQSLNPDRIIGLYEQIINNHSSLFEDSQTAPWSSAKISEDLYWNYLRIPKKNKSDFLKNCRTRIVPNVRFSSQKINSKKVLLFIWRLLYLN